MDLVEITETGKADVKDEFKNRISNIKHSIRKDGQVWRIKVC